MIIWGSHNKYSVNTDLKEVEVIKITLYNLA